MSHSEVEVACLGILVADFFSSPLPRLPKPGELMVVDEVTHYTGGCAANTAVALAKLGIHAGVVGKVGRDPFGALIIDDLNGKGVDTSEISISARVGTSKTLILPVIAEDRRYIHKLGANADFGIDDVNLDYLSKAKLIYIGGYPALSKLSQEALVSILKYAKEAGIITVLDIILPGPGNWLAKCQDALAYVDAFMPNNDEAEGLTGEEDPAKQADVLLQYGPRMVVITMGAQGALLMTRNETIRASSYRVHVKDGSGAGDAFDAGFIAGLLSSWRLEDTLTFASVMGASCVRELGCTAGLFSMQEARAFVEHNPIELNVERSSCHD